jgi:hypothetical protein
MTLTDIANRIDSAVNPAARDRRMGVDPAAGAAARRIAALRRFALSLTVLNVLGQAVLGFEQSYLQPVLAVLTAYALELGLEALNARLQRRPAAYAGGLRGLVDFLLPAHITGLAVSMLLFTNSEIKVLLFAVAIAIASKHVFRLRQGSGERHFLNPSNFGISCTLLLFPWVGMAPPYMFTENVHGALNWILPLLLLAFGTFLNWRLTGKLPLIIGWVFGFAAQAVIRGALFGDSTVAALAPMTGLVFVLYTCYMITDPATTPAVPWRQVVFGVAVAAVYGVLVVMHVVFGLFFALTLVCIARGLLVWSVRTWRELALSRRPAPVQPPPAQTAPQQPAAGYTLTMLERPAPEIRAKSRG